MLEYWHANKERINLKKRESKDYKEKATLRHRRWRAANVEYIKAYCKKARARPERKASAKAYLQLPARRALGREAGGRKRRARLQPVQIPQHIYIMLFAEHPDVFKVGRAVNIENRCYQLNTSLFLTVEVVAQYENLGYLEPKVHDCLDQYRVTTGHGREWFRCPLDHIKSAINYIISNTAASSSEAPVQSVSEDLDHPGESDEEDAC